MTLAPDQSPVEPPTPPLPLLPRYRPRYTHNIRAVPQIDAHCRDEFGPLPLITLSGTWLRTLGFGVGVQVRIEATQGRIVITPLWNSEPIGLIDGEREKPAVRYTGVEDREAKAA
jgi:hypothetical protein